MTTFDKRVIFIMYLSVPIHIPGSPNHDRTINCSVTIPLVGGTKYFQIFPLKNYELLL